MHAIAFVGSEKIGIDTSTGKEGGGLRAQVMQRLSSDGVSQWPWTFITKRAQKLSGGSKVLDIIKIRPTVLFNYMMGRYRF